MLTRRAKAYRSSGSVV